MIGCPSDVTDEVEIAKDIIIEWSMINTDARGMALIPTHWKRNAYPIANNPPQKSINKQLVDKSDLLVCIFAAKIGSPTDTAESGSIEEIEEHVKAGKPVMLYFRTNIDIKSTTPDNLQKLCDFKSRMQKSNLYWEYTDEKDFADVFRRQLQQFLNDNWIKDAQENLLFKEERVVESHIPFEDDELSVFSKWANNPADSSFMAMWMIHGLEVHFGYQNSYTYPRGEAEAGYEDFMNRLQQAGYITPVGEKNNVMQYKLTKQGYDFAKTLL